MLSSELTQTIDPYINLIQLFFFLIILPELEQKQYICQLYRRKKITQEAFAIHSTSHFK